MVDLWGVIVDERQRNALQQQHNDFNNALATVQANAGNANAAHQTLATAKAASATVPWNVHYYGAMADGLGSWPIDRCWTMSGGAAVAGWGGLPEEHAAAPDMASTPVIALAMSLRVRTIRLAPPSRTTSESSAPHPSANL